jgi:DNA primase
MNAAEFLSRLDGVQQRGARWSARCPAHNDTSPSLSVSEGERGLLVKCWAGCTVAEICGAIGIEQRDLFFDSLDADPAKRRAAAQQRDRQRLARERHAQQEGTLIDALREADTFIRSRRGIDISAWSHTQLNDELNTLSEAYLLLESEGLNG